MSCVMDYVHLFDNEYCANHVKVTHLIKILATI